MDNNRLRHYESNNDNKKINPVILVFAGIQAILIILAIATIVRMNSDNITEDNPAYEEKTPQFTIKDLAKKASILNQDDVTNIQKKVFKIIAKNTNSIDVNTVEATIRDDMIYQQSFGDNVKYLNMTIDVPDLKQSYDVYYSPNAVLDPEESTFVLCSDGEELIYKDFDCKGSDNVSIRNTIVKTFLGYFKFNYFTAYADADNPTNVIISPSVTYNNSEATKSGYIDEVRSAIDSLGISPDDYTYYVRTAADVSYDDNWP